MRIDVLLHSVADGLAEPDTPSPSPRVRILIWSLVVFSSLLCRHHGHRSPQGPQRRRRQCQFNALREGAAVQCREQYPPPSAPSSHEFCSLFLSLVSLMYEYDVITGPSVVVIERDSLNQALLKEPLLCLCPLLRATAPCHVASSTTSGRVHFLSIPRGHLLFNCKCGSGGLSARCLLM